MGTLIRYPYEVRDEKEYFDDIQDVKVTKDMLDLAMHIELRKSGEMKCPTCSADGAACGAGSHLPAERHRSDGLTSAYPASLIASKKTRPACGRTHPDLGLFASVVAIERRAAKFRRAGADPFA
jgi:hypothetical protein